ncbi:MAG: hypothetical protein ACRDQW_10725 [Haloechinothrix sp.]
MDAKKTAVLAVAVLVLFFVISAPTQAADAAHTLLGALEDAAIGIVTFLKHLFT